MLNEHEMEMILCEYVVVFCLRHITIIIGCAQEREMNELTSEAVTKPAAPRPRPGM